LDGPDIAAEKGVGDHPAQGVGRLPEVRALAALEGEVEAEQREDDVHPDRKQVIAERVGVVLDGSAVGIRLGIVFVFHELEGREDERGAVGLRELEQAFQIAHHFAAADPDIHAADIDPEGYEHGEQRNRQPIENDLQIGRHGGDVPG